MRPGRAPVRIPGVDETRTTVQLTVTLVTDSDPVRGSIGLPDGQRREFWGWLELAEIVQQATEWGDGAAEGQLTPSQPLGAPLR